MAQQAPPTMSRPCPSCGVAVAPGYPRCPRCQTAMPGARLARPAAPSSVPEPVAPSPSGKSWRAGGTSVTQSGPAPWKLLAGAAGVLVLVVAIVWALASGGKDPRAPVASPDEPEVPEAAEPGDEPLGTEAGSSGAGLRVPAAPEPDGERRGADRAVNELNDLLRDARLWSTVKIDRADPSVVIIQSSLCDDENLSRVLADAVSELKSHGVATVRCVAPHGSVMFEKTL